MATKESLSADLDGQRQIIKAKGTKSVHFEKPPLITVMMDCPSAEDIHPLRLMRSRRAQNFLGESLKIYDKSRRAFGEYKLPTGSRYVGSMKNGHFHGMGVLYLPQGTECRGMWNEGRYIKGKMVFADGLEWDAADWDYCIEDDRRFYSEIVYGIKPAGKSQLTNKIPPPRIPTGSYDTGDGFFDPVTGVVTGYNGSFMRYANEDEREWIVAKCRKGWDEKVGRRNLYGEKKDPYVFVTTSESTKLRGS